MLPIPTRSVFRNRWWTLAWAAGIVWSAAQFAGSDRAGGGGGNAANGTMEDASGAIVNEQQAAEAAAVIARIGG